MDMQLFTDAVRSSIAAGKWNALDDWIVEDCSLMFKDGNASLFDPVDDAFVDFVIGLLSDPVYLDVKNSFQLLYVVEAEWQLISTHQKTALLPALEAAYPRFHDPMARFMTAELLGDFYGDEPALQTLQRLASLPDASLRELVPMGLGHLIRSPDVQLAERARSLLNTMAEDPSENVRGEVGIALRKASPTSERVKRKKKHRRPSKRND